MKLIIFIVLVTCSTLRLNASSDFGQQLSREFRANQTRSVVTKYLLYLPQDYFATKQTLPVIIYLHGGSIRGNDVQKLRTLGLPKHLEADRAFPFIVISPLCPAGEIWTDAEAVIGILDEVLASYRADQSRVYITGHSMGGRGALYLAYKYPDRIAAVLSMSALSPINEWAERLKRVPIWYFHGVEDKLAPISDGDEFVRAVQAVGGDIRYSRLERRGHPLLDIYDQQDWYKWLLEHRRGAK